MIFKNRFYIGEKIRFIRTDSDGKWFVCTVQFTIEEITRGRFGDFYWTEILPEGHGRGCLDEDGIFREKEQAQAECDKRNKENHNDT